jgi:flagellar protein FlaJ
MTNDAIVSLVRPATNQKLLAAIQNTVSDNLTFWVRTSGRTASPKTLALQSTAYMIFSVFIVVPLSIVLGVVFDRLFFALLAIPFFIFLLPSIKLRLCGSDRKSAIEDEIAFFSAYGSIMQTIGRTLYASMLQVIGKTIFPAIEDEGRMLKRNIALFGMDQCSALNSLAISHPNIQFRNLLLGYVSIQKSGGDLGQYMERRSEEFFNGMKFRFFKYASSAETIAETALILLSILPVLLIMSSFLIGHDSLQIVTNLSFVVIPVVTGILITVTSNIQPKTHDKIGFGGFSLVIGVVSGIIGFFFVQEAWFVLAITVFTSAIINFVFLSRQFAEIAMTENALADFFRDVTEYRKIGIAIPNAIIRISKERRYNKFFDGMLSDMSSGLSYGTSLVTIIDSLSIRSWHARVSFFILSKVAESGGGTPQVLEQITSFSTKIVQAKNEMVARVKIFTYLAYGSPLLIVWSSQGMKDLLEKITPEYARLMNGMGSGLILSTEFLQMVNLLMVISSLCIGMIMTKITYFTMKHTLTIGVTSAIAVVSVYVIPFFPSL